MHLSRQARDKHEVKPFEEYRRKEKRVFVCVCVCVCFLTHHLYRYPRRRRRVCSCEGRLNRLLLEPHPSHDRAEFIRRRAKGAEKEKKTRQEKTRKDKKRHNAVLLLSVSVLL